MNRTLSKSYLPRSEGIFTFPTRRLQPPLNEGARLASFYAQLFDWPLVDSQPNHAIVKPPQDSIYLMFQRVPDFVAPTWPGTPGQQRMTMHLDIQVEDLDAAVANAVTLGARVADLQPNDNVRVLLDPAGHPFCLCRDDQ